MSPTTQLPYFAVPALIALGVTGCTAPPVPVSDETYASAPATDEPATPTATPIDADAVLLVRATATASNGATLALEAQVHQAYGWDYAGIGTLPAALLEDCAGSLTQSQIEQEAWSFVRVNVSALPGAGTEWPSDTRIDARPSADYALIAGRGMMANDPKTGDVACLQDKYFTAAGNGGLAIGLPGDAASLTGWSNHTYGFVAQAGVVLGGCSIEITPLGASLGAGTETWTSTIDDSTCVAGEVNEKIEY